METDRLLHAERREPPRQAWLQFPGNQIAQIGHGYNPSRSGVHVPNPGWVVAQTRLTGRYHPVVPVHRVESP